MNDATEIWGKSDFSPTNNGFEIWGPSREYDAAPDFLPGHLTAEEVAQQIEYSILTGRFDRRGPFTKQKIVGHLPTPIFL